MFQPTSSSAKGKRNRLKTNRKGSQWDSTHTIFGQTEKPAKSGIFLSNEDKAQNIQKANKENALEYSVQEKKKKKTFDNCFVAYMKTL